MGTDSVVALTAGSGTSIETFSGAGGHHQYVRQAEASATVRDSWAVSTTGSAAKIPADRDRTCVLLVNDQGTNTARVYIRFDGTIPSAVDYDWFLEPNERYEVPQGLKTTAISFIGTAITGTLRITLPEDP